MSAYRVPQMPNEPIGILRMAEDRVIFVHELSPYVRRRHSGECFPDPAACAIPNGTLRRVEEVDGALYVVRKWSKGRKRAERAAQRKRHHPSLGR
jgi:hypothetical protein